MVGDVEKRLPADQVFVEWYGGAITSIRVADLKPLWFEPERTPPQQPRRAPQQQFRPASPAGPRRVRTELITETPTDPNRPMGTPPPPQRMPDGSVAYTVYETVEPVDPSQLQEPAGRYRNPDGSWRYVTYETEEPA
ncbi:hypothetical protein [Curtobacterium sp. MCSS17_016]|uniref:hypothetical protein n=1 Tax=Curtobacterium sp. MCSS17_016 TaxID=2175644 RepID=UPI000DA81C6F|nr:hypothetical protein [Curtobacterium sp. MCSS17_016]WIE81408.1 hypothetical protein DEJ19_019425 [Curtobacterium sp. MCSS17_016]